MGLKQKISDITLLVKTQRKYQIIVALMVGALAFLVVNGPGNQKPKSTKADKKPKKTQSQKLVKRHSGDETADDVMAAMNERLAAMETIIKENQDKDKSRDSIIEKDRVRTAEIFRKMLERMADNENRLGEGALIQGEPGADGSVPGVDPVDVHMHDSGEPTEPDQLELFGEIQDAKEAPPPLPAGPTRIAFIGAGDSVRVKLLSGVRAPTDGTPYPVLLKLMSEIMGPDGSTLPLGEARLVAAAQGSLTDSRVLFRLSKLNMRFPDGRHKVIDVDGWIVGEDGIRGLQGVAIDPLGKSIGAAIAIGGVGAAGAGLAKSATDVSSDAFGNTTEIANPGDLGTYSLGKAIQGGTNEWSKIVAERARELVPQIEVLSGREATAVFAQSVAIRGLFESLQDEDAVMTVMD